MRCRGEHCSPVLGVCCKFRIVGDDTLGVPLEGVRFVFFSQAMQGDKGCRGVGTSYFCKAEIAPLPYMVCANTPRNHLTPHPNHAIINSGGDITWKCLI